ncbi:hypothetical protein FNF29_06245 [Cafeteria roenbergensis]|uniref:Thiamin pyrophosphokinase thiamin-binding domain-containing protein n=1 Tax=Cafeteria roenbergensis TaxID=33653 RepID=A0A5A8CAZ2_CAFRO|nr:hypothetical protein FNF29_06245 [Cafeteria roenbergensis]|eukprot:KAA0148961.1 hypothetical protein FNF29_06245 [Cafeteria roenbergensis]
MAAGPGAGVDRCLGEAIGARGRPPAGRPLAVLMLNSPDEPARGLAAACLRRADVVVFGDGALGRYGWALEGVDGLRAKVLGVVGDFDSIVDGDGRGVMRIGIPSQDANDMFKCLAVLKEAANACAGAAAAGSVADLSALRLAAAALRCLGLEGDAKDGTEPAAAGAPPAAAGSDVAAPCISSECAKALTLGPGSFDVVVLGGLGGRFDHEAQSLNALVVWEGEFASMWLLSTFSAVTLLPAGASRVRLSPPFEGPTCGVIPIGEPPSRVVTTGLRWNLGPELKLAYGACVSSSNHAEDDVVAVETDRPVLFTAALDCDSLAAE